MASLNIFNEEKDNDNDNDNDNNNDNNNINIADILSDIEEDLTFSQIITKYNDDSMFNSSMFGNNTSPGRHGKMYSFPVSHVFNHKNKFRSYYRKNKFNFSFILHSDIDFKFSLRHRKSYKFPVS